MMAQGAVRRWAAAWSLSLALGTFAAAPAVAQTRANVTKAENITAKVVVNSVDRATRHVTVTNPKGETFTIAVPPEARNFDQLKPGDKVTITYQLETEYVLSAPNTPLPKDAVAQVEARTPKGQRPGGFAARRITVTGAVVAIDRKTFSFKLVNPKGGQVHTVAVQSIGGLRALEKMKIGDTVTAYVTESLLLKVDPA